MKSLSLLLFGQIHSKAVFCGELSYYYYHRCDLYFEKLLCSMMNLIITLVTKRANNIFFCMKCVIDITDVVFMIFIAIIIIPTTVHYCSY